MSKSGLAGLISGPKVDDAVDRGDPFIRAIIDGFLKIGTVAATRAAAEDAYCIAKKVGEDGRTSGIMGAFGAVYAGVECKVSRIRGTRDRKTAMIGGRIDRPYDICSGAAGNNNRDRVVLDAITGGAIAAAAELLKNMT